jgi:hypothetical protein
MPASGFNWYKVLIKFKKFIKAYKADLAKARVCLNFFENQIYNWLGVLNFAKDCAYEECLSRGFFFAIDFSNLVLCWWRLLEEIGRRFWLLWCDTLKFFLSCVIQALASLRLLWVIDHFYGLLLLLVGSFLRFLRFGDIFGWEKLSISLLVRLFYVWLRFKQFCLGLWNFCKKCKGAYTSKNIPEDWLLRLSLIKARFSLLWGPIKVRFSLLWDPIKVRFSLLWDPIKVRFSLLWDPIKVRFSLLKGFLLSRLQELSAYLKLYWSTIDWSKEPYKFLLAFSSSLAEKLSFYRLEIAKFYKELWYGIARRFILLFGDNMLGEFIPFFLWLTFYLTIWSNGIYFAYLSAKFWFYTFKYLLDFSYFIVDFFFCYFVEGVPLFTGLYKLFVRVPYRLINFFFFYGLPNLVSIAAWRRRKEKYWDLLLSAIPRVKSAGFSILGTLFNLRRSLRYALVFCQMHYLDFITAIRAAKHKIERFFRSRYLFMLLKYRVRHFSFTKEGLRFWSKVFKLRLRFVATNIREKTIKFFYSLIRNQINYLYAKFKAILINKIAPKVALFKHKLFIATNWKTYYHRVIIVYSKLIRALCFLLLNIIYFVICLQCLYFAVFNKFDRFYKNEGYEHERANTERLLQKLKEKIEQNSKQK